MNIKTFADELAAVTFTGVVKRYNDIPDSLREADLPAQITMMPTAAISPQETVWQFGTFDAQAAVYTTEMYFPVAAVSQGFPDRQRDAVLDMAAEIEEWAIQTPWQVTMDTTQRLKVGSQEYRGVLVSVTSVDME